MKSSSFGFPFASTKTAYKKSSINKDYINFKFPEENFENINQFQNNLKLIFNSEDKFINSCIENTNSNSIKLFETYLNNYLITEGYHIDLSDPLNLQGIKNLLDNNYLSLSYVFVNDRLCKNNLFEDKTYIFDNFLNEYLSRFKYETSDDTIKSMVLKINTCLELIKKIGNYILCNKKDLFLQPLHKNKIK